MRSVWFSKAMRPSRLVPLILLCIGCGARTSLVDESEPEDADPLPIAESHIFVFDAVSFQGMSRLTGLDGLEGNGRITYLGDGSLWNACNPVFDAEGRLYFSDAGAGPRVLRLDLEAGEWRTLGAAIDGPSSLAFDAEERIYITDNALHRLIRVDDIDGGGLVSFGGPSKGTGIGAFDSPSGVAITQGGKILVADRRNARVVQMDDMEGNGWTSFDLPEGAVGEARPSDVALDSEGRILIVDFNNSVLHRIDDISGAGHASQLLPAQLSHVVVGEGDRLYFSFLNGLNAIGSESAFGADDLVLFDGGDDPFINPCGVAVR